MSRPLPWFLRLEFWTGRVPGSRRLAGFFLRGLALIQLLFFGSLLPQIRGLFGSRGVLPAAQVWENLVAEGGKLEAFLALPGWHVVFGVSDSVLLGVGGCGILGSLGLLLNLFPAAGAAVAASCILSLISLGTLFLQFQWDALLLESSLLGLLLTLSLPASRGVRGLARFKRQRAEVPLVLFGAFLFLNVRLWFGSAFVKLASGDPLWRSLTALRVHFETQPLPTPWAPKVHFLIDSAPDFLARGLTLGVLGIEGVLPWLLWGATGVLLSGRLRSSVGVRLFLAKGVLVLLLFQAAIALTGNYAFFNALTALLLVWFLVGLVLPGGGALPVLSAEGLRGRGRLLSRAACINAMAALWLSVQVLWVVPQWLGGRAPSFLLPASQWGLVQSYGLFARMTRERDELVLQGSVDGKIWSDFEFRYKPGRTDRPLSWIAPHQPRLDWQAWFAALEEPSVRSWWRLLMLRVLAGEPRVLALFETVPQPPPRFVRTLKYRYRFDPAGKGWQRELRGVHFPELSIVPR
jgi:hypothetical protein